APTGCTGGGDARAVAAATSSVARARAGPRARRTGARAARSGPEQRRPPVHARAEGDEQHEVACAEAPAAHRFVPQEGDGGGGSVAVALDVVEHLALRDAQRLLAVLVDALVGL